MKALVFAGIVRQVEQEPFDVAPPMQWIDAPEEVAPGWSYKDGDFSPPPAGDVSEVPRSITRRQGRLALLDAGKLDDVEAAIAAITDPTQRRAAEIEYEADTWERGNEFLQSMWAHLGGTDADLDALFIAASGK